MNGLWNQIYMFYIGHQHILRLHFSLFVIIAAIVFQLSRMIWRIEKGAETEKEQEIEQTETRCFNVNKEIPM